MADKGKKCSSCGSRKAFKPGPTRGEEQCKNCGHTQPKKM